MQDPSRHQTPQYGGPAAVAVARSVGGQPLFTLTTNRRRFWGKNGRPATLTGHGDRRRSTILGGMGLRWAGGRGRRGGDRGSGAWELSPPSPTTRRYARGDRRRLSAVPGEGRQHRRRRRPGKVVVDQQCAPEPRGAPLEGLPSRPHTRSWEGLVEQNRRSASAEVTEDAFGLKLAPT